MYEQITSINYNIPYTGGLCEKYVENTAGQNGVFPTAHAAWQAHPDHLNGLIPSGVKVALHFTLSKNPDGHTAVSLGDGRIASSTQSGTHATPYIHPSLADLIEVYSNPTNGTCTYIGWSEYIGKLKVVGEEMKPTNAQIDQWISLFYQEAYGKAPTDAIFAQWRPVLSNNFVDGSLSIMQGTDTNAGALKNGGSEYKQITAYVKE